MSGQDSRVELALQHEREGRFQEAVNVLGAAAMAGDARAQFMLGLRLLPFGNDPQDRAQGVTFIEMAAKQGDGAALHFAAVLAAAGYAGAPDWEAAMTRLRGAAAKGHAGAAGQLAALGATFSAARWATSPPPAKAPFEDVRIGVIEGFLTKAMCDWIIQAAGPRLKRAAVRSAATGESRNSADRTNSGAHISLAESDLVVRLTQARLAAALGAPLQHHEFPNILHYDVGETFATHFDFFDPASPGYAQQLAGLGQRVATFLIYLNDDFESGETDFPALGWRFKGKTGDALFFWNVDHDGAPDRRLAHAGLPPTRGQKWLFSQWVRARPVPLI